MALSSIYIFGIGSAAFMADLPPWHLAIRYQNCLKIEGGI